MSDTAADLTALLADVRAKAEAVPSLYRTGWEYANCGDVCCQWLDSDHLAEGHDPLNSPSALTHIARMEPATTLRLVDAVERLARERDAARAENERLRREYTPCDLDLLSRAEAAEAEVADARTRLADADAVRDQWKRTAAAHELRANAAEARLADVRALIPTTDLELIEAGYGVPADELLRVLDGPQEGGEGR